MTQNTVNLIVGSLLHDFGKLLYHHNDSRDHAGWGADFLAQNISLNATILEQVRYHHLDQTAHSKLKSDALAYITATANQLAHQTTGSQQPTKQGEFIRKLPLSSVFRLLYTKSQPQYYQPALLQDIALFPIPETDPTADDFYDRGMQSIVQFFKANKLQSACINPLLELLETQWSYLPSVSTPNDATDISLFSHAKMTAAIACCIEQYLTQSNLLDYKQILQTRQAEFNQKDAFLLYSLDLSGIQDFIYNITQEKAAKAIRARSFYLELLLENALDNLLDRLELSRCNIIYAGGGHAYLLLSNTDQTSQQLKSFETEINTWLLHNFGTALYLCCAGVACSANALQNKPQGSYTQLFKDVSAKISAKKLHRYSAADIRKLNRLSGESTQECKHCLQTKSLLENGLCHFCNRLVSFSANIQKTSYYSIVNQYTDRQCLPIFEGQWLVSDTPQSLTARQQSDSFVRCYAKNGYQESNRSVNGRIWIADHGHGSTFHELADASAGIDRIAVLRADVDDLGKAFAQGFEQNQDEYPITLARTATLSNQLTLFFKRHLNNILKHGQYTLTDKSDLSRNVTVIYSGGDDLFVIGAWDDIFGFAVDLHTAFDAFSEGKLTLSAGIGLYHPHHPVSLMAQEVGELEQYAKAFPDKNAVAIFDEQNVYSWEELIQDVLGQKLTCIQTFFNRFQGYGSTFLFNLLELLRDRQDRINIARYAYLLARMRPDDGSYEQKQAYQTFATQMHNWIKSEEDSKKLITAIRIYLYSTRQTGGTDESY